MPVKLVNVLDFDLAGHLTGTKSGIFIHRTGFDPVARFQMVAVGQRRQLSTEGGDTKGLSIIIKPETICKFVATPDLAAKIFNRTGIITIEGVSEGDAELILTDAKGATVDKVAINVVKFRSVTTRFYNLVDGKGRQGVRDPDHDANFTSTALADLVDFVNSIVLAQCDVMMFKSGLGLLRDLKFTDDLGNQVDINKVNPFKSTDLDGAAQYHVAFVWSIEGPHSNGITKSNFTLLQSGLSADKRKMTLAHEFVHFLSGSGIVKVGDHDDERSDLLFITAPHGVMMRKDRLKKIIHG